MSINWGPLGGSEVFLTGGAIAVDGGNLNLGFAGVISWDSGSGVDVDVDVGDGDGE